MIRELSKNDYDQFIELINTKITKKDFELFLTNNLQLGQHIILVYEMNNKIIGTGTILIETKLTYNISYLGHIENIFVSEEYRNKGIGKEIVKCLCKYANEKKCYRIDLACEEQLIPFYKRLGFDKQIYCMSMLNKDNFK
jgi:GNAT superfamily N-acetyltransferase